MIPNNVISYELLAAFESAAAGERRTWSPVGYGDYAEKLNRLVEAAWEAKKILNHGGGTSYDAATKYGCADKLAAALRDIELPKARRAEHERARRERERSNLDAQENNQ